MTRCLEGSPLRGGGQGVRRDVNMASQAAAATTVGQGQQALTSSHMQPSISGLCTVPGKKKSVSSPSVICWKYCSHSSYRPAQK